MKKLSLNTFKQLLILILGNFILACGINFFILPYDILTGGIFGVSIALKPIIPFVDTNYLAYFLIFATFILGLIFLGKDFAIKTAVSSLIYPIFLEMLRNVDYVINVDPILASVYGGLITGIALGLVFKSHASTGGMDVFPLILYKYFNIKTSSGLLIIDGITVMLGIYTLGIEHVLLGLVSVFTSSYMIDKVLLFGSEKTMSIMVISEYLDNINHRIQVELDRGTTIISAVGGYKKDSRNILLCVVTVEQYQDLKDIVLEEDDRAFIVVQDAHEILGEGFTLGHRI